MIHRYGLVFIIFLVTGCQLMNFSKPSAAEQEVENQFQRALLLLNEQEYQKAAEVYLRINKDYPHHPRAQEAGILGQELQRVLSLTQSVQSLTASNEKALKNLREMTERFKRLSEQNAILEGFERENLRLRSELHQMEQRLKELASLKQENSRLQSEMDRIKASLKELREIEQKMKQPMESPSRPGEGVR